MPQRKKFVLLLFYVLATVQFAWCYFWLTRPYVNTALYEQGRERMPFQGRLLMTLPMRLAGHSAVLHALTPVFKLSRFWFPRPVAPEVLVQAAINVGCLLLAGFFTVRIYQASSTRRLLTPMVYPLLLVVAAATYVMHTVQNFRFIYDLPSLAFFSAAMYLLYRRRHWAWFAGLFVLATINRETTLLLLPLYLINEAAPRRSKTHAVTEIKADPARPHHPLNLQYPLQGGLDLRRLLRLQPWLLTGALGLLWAGWQIFLRHHFAHNPSEFYPRLDWNVKSILVPQAWPQLLSACGYLMLFVVALRRRLPDPQLRAWLWILPVWLVFMFVYGILIETRVFGELIPLVVVSTTLIVEQLLVARIAVAAVFAPPALAQVSTAAAKTAAVTQAA